VQTAGYAGQLSAGMVVTGGAAAMQGIAELASDVFGTGVRVGKPAENLAGLTEAIESPRFATVVGLAQYAAHQVAARDESPSVRRRQLAGAGVGHLTQRIKYWLEDFF
jgi:cell division protein FtsA